MNRRAGNRWFTARRRPPCLRTFSGDMLTRTGLAALILDVLLRVSYSCSTVLLFHGARHDSRQWLCPQLSLIYLCFGNGLGTILEKPKY